MKIFCDFDGTAAANDVGNLLFRTFADRTCFDIVKQWKEGSISSKECLLEECKITRVTKPELERFADSQGLDPYFAEFASFCQTHDIDIEIVSDGFDFYINRILKNHNLDSCIRVRSNLLKFLNGNRIRPEFPYFSSGCGQCGNCKGYHVRQAKEEGHKVVYVGDGLSDRCGAKEADMVFAKRGRDLLNFCKETGIRYLEYESFEDVLDKLKDIRNADLL